MKKSILIVLLLTMFAAPVMAAEPELVNPELFRLLLKEKELELEQEKMQKRYKALDADLKDTQKKIVEEMKKRAKAQ